MRSTVYVYAATLSKKQTDYLIRPLLNRLRLQDIPLFVLSFGYIYWQIGEVIVCEQRPDTVSSVSPPPLSPVSDFVSLAICSHCAVLPDGRHSGRLGSANCKGMWHSVLKLRMFLWISRVCDGQLFFIFILSIMALSGESVSAPVFTRDFVLSGLPEYKEF